MESKYFRFRGDGGQYFAIYITNFLLTLLTFGLYYPWARAKNMRYLYSQTDLDESAFAFHGTGKEMFRGFLILIGVVGFFYGCFGLLAYMATQNDGEWTTTMIVAAIALYLGFFALIPLAIHGAMRYRLSRTSWRGIRFAYDGKRGHFVGQYYGWVALTVITLGFYGSWMQVNTQKYLVGNSRFGNARMHFRGQGGDYFVLNLVGIMLTYLTLGIYSFWFIRNLYRFNFNNMELEINGELYRAKTEITAGDIFFIVVVYPLGSLLTLGLAHPWMAVNSHRRILNSLHIQNNPPLDHLVQTHRTDASAAGDEMVDMMDLGVGLGI